jgi:hypothetical protein
MAPGSYQFRSTATRLHKAGRYRVGVTALNNWLVIMQKLGLATRWQSGPREWTYEAVRK